jgi:biopolymer transport protein ExbB
MAALSHDSPLRRTSHGTLRGNDEHLAIIIPMNALVDQLAMLIQRGGWVMFPLLALSIISLTLIIERLWFWIALHNPARHDLLRKLNDALRRGEKSKVEKLLARDRSPYALAARHLLRHGSTDAVIIEAIEAQRPKFDRFMVTLSTIITAAPLLGILGTVLGIIRSFNLLGDQATLTDPRMVSGGIAEALLTTALGLVIALMTLFPYMAFRAQGERAQARLETVMAATQQGLGERAKAEARSSGVASQDGETIEAPAPAGSERGEGSPEGQKTHERATPART